MFSLIKFCGFILILICCQKALATNHTDSWNSAIITGPLANDKKIKYYIQPGQTFEDDTYKYRSTFLYLGAGYQTSPTVIMWLMGAWHHRLRASGSTLNIATIREQIDSTVRDSDAWRLNSTSRLEERRDVSLPQWLLRGREKLTLRAPFKNWQNHSLVAFDEVYVNFTNPPWLNNNSFFDINNAFVGVGTQLSDVVSFDFGYLNQYVQRTTGNNDNNVIYLMFYVSFL